jgi:NAD+ synthase (glutamine-hydrolysing)
MSSPAVRGRSFDSLYRHGYVRVAVATPRLCRAVPEFNGVRTLALAGRASADGAAVVIFPEVGISAYAIDDLLHQESVLSAVREALTRVVAQSRALLPVIVAGAPLRHEG